MGMFDTIIGDLECPQCRKTREREIQTHRGPSLMETYYIGDTIEPFYFGNYWFEEEWYCVDCYKRDREKDENVKPHWYKAYVHCINGLIIQVSKARGEEEPLPDWTLIHKISRDRHNYRSTLLRIDDMIQGLTHREEGEAPFNLGQKTVDEVLERIREYIAGALSGEPPGMF